ncbi:MAG: metallophosphoesterase [Phaeodactylibacter sp.]|nr:metallophosphoesterase [Phaeodactylibacter sp.]MCB9297266.1 metallophosphoesterase [Lewinellaceae bacterium]
MIHIVDLINRNFRLRCRRLFLPASCLLLAFGAVACREAGPATPERYIFLGHPYDWNSTDRVDPRLERLDYSAYRQVWLGGDVCARTAEHPEALPYLDSLFDLKNGHWALGNHDYDYGDPQVILDFLQRPSFYTRWQDGYCLMVLNTNFFWPYPSNPPQRDCEQKAAQWAMVRSVTDTIREASHLVILHHLGVFNDLKVDEKGDTLRAFNVNAAPLYGTCDPDSEITGAVYPWLAEVQKRGVQVVLIGGDVGMQAKQFEFRTPEGIWMLGSGINNTVNQEYAPEYVKDFGPDKVLLLEYDKGKRELSWSFVDLDGLVKE